MNGIIYQNSVIEDNGTTYFLVKDEAGGAKYLAVKGDTNGFEGDFDENGILHSPLTSSNASNLRSRLPWLRPVSLGLDISFGFGDRLGLATPGHIRAVRQTGIAPVFAQQSVRENLRTGRTPQEVLDDAMWGVFQEGWRGKWGADADHLKTPEDIKPFVRAGYTFFTIDPGDLVANISIEETKTGLMTNTGRVPWESFVITQNDLYKIYLNKTFHLEGFELVYDEETLLRALLKYGQAIAHTSLMYNQLLGLMGQKAFDLELSLDETASPTSIYEHFFVASELARLGIKCISLAPRYIGKFEKGVDYIGDSGEFESEIKLHAKVLRYFGNYKLSLHSGSDKFSIYPFISRHTRGKLHIKTAGTSYLEALRVVAEKDPAFFREILAFSQEKYRTDRASYFVSAEIDKMAPPDGIKDSDLSSYLDQFDAREILHVTFGSVLGKWGERLKSILREHEEFYYSSLEKHFNRHLEPFHEMAVHTND